MQGSAPARREPSTGRARSGDGRVWLDGLQRQGHQVLAGFSLNAHTALVQSIGEIAIWTRSRQCLSGKQSVNIARAAGGATDQPRVPLTMQALTHMLGVLITARVNQTWVGADEGPKIQQQGLAVHFVHFALNAHPQ